MKKKRKNTTKKRPIKRVAPWSGFRLRCPRDAYLGGGVSHWDPAANDSVCYDGDHRWGEYDDPEYRKR